MLKVSPACEEREEKGREKERKEKRSYLSSFSNYKNSGAPSAPVTLLPPVQRVSWSPERAASHLLTNQQHWPDSLWALCLSCQVTTAKPSLCKPQDHAKDVLAFCFERHLTGCRLRERKQLLHLQTSIHHPDNTAEPNLLRAQSLHRKRWVGCSLTGAPHDTPNSTCRMEPRGAAILAPLSFPATVERALWMRRHTLIKSTLNSKIRVPCLFLFYWYVFAVHNN